MFKIKQESIDENTTGMIQVKHILSCQSLLKPIVKQQGFYGQGNFIKYHVYIITRHIILLIYFF